MYIKVQNNPDLMRDSESKGVINIDTPALSAYKKQRQIDANKTSEVKKVQTDISQLKDEISVIKQMLTEILNK